MSGNFAKPATCWKSDQATDCNDDAFVSACFAISATIRGADEGGA
jgi:hypothetical protein